jgi:arginase
MRELVLIKAPSNLGLSEPIPGREPGVKDFPDALEKTGFAERAGIFEKAEVPSPPYSTEIDRESKVRNADAIATYSQRLATVVENCLNGENKPIVVGGDCSVLIGAALGLKRTGNFALFFLDGHTDYVMPHQSGTAGAAGMDLAIVTGNGHNKLTNIEGLKPYFNEENVFCVGNRETSESWYVNAIRGSNICYMDLADLREKRIPAVIELFWKMLRQNKPAGFWIHFDVDVLDDALMPCVDSRQPGGLSYHELADLLKPLLASPHFCGMTVTILDPTLDKENKFLKPFATVLGELLKSAVLY